MRIDLNSFVIEVAMKVCAAPTIGPIAQVEGEGPACAVTRMICPGG
ncbi:MULTISPECIES: hypothetical protein [unclassified Mycobacterium]|nr:MULTISPECIES: hypothetical protein [unclassified Mycobacterium]